MILKTLSYQTSDGSIHPTIESAQKYEAYTLMKEMDLAVAPDEQVIVDFLFAHKDKLIDILTMKASSKPKARKINGAAKKRTPKNEQPQTQIEPAV